MLVRTSTRIISISHKSQVAQTGGRSCCSSTSAIARDMPPRECTARLTYVKVQPTCVHVMIVCDKPDLDSASCTTEFLARFGKITGKTANKKGDGEKRERERDGDLIDVRADTNRVHSNLTPFVDAS